MTNDWNVYTFKTSATLLFSSVGEKTIWKNYPDKKPKYYANFGLDKEDAAAIESIIKSLMHDNFGAESNTNNCHICYTTGKTSAAKERERAEFKCKSTPNISFDEKEKILKNAEVYAEEYSKHSGILRASSVSDLILSRWSNAQAKVVDIPEDARIEAQKTYFYPGAKVRARVTLKAIRRRSLDSKDIITCFLNNIMFAMDGERLTFGGQKQLSGSEAFADFKGPEEIQIQDDFDSAF